MITVSACEPRIGGRRHIDPEAVDDAESRRLAEVCLARKKVILLAHQVAGGQETAVEPERTRALAVDDQRAVGLACKHLVAGESDERSRVA